MYLYRVRISGDVMEGGYAEFHLGSCCSFHLMEESMGIIEMLAERMEIEPGELDICGIKKLEDKNHEPIWISNFPAHDHGDDDDNGGDDDDESPEDSPSPEDGEKVMVEESKRIDARHESFSEKAIDEFMKSDKFNKGKKGKE